MATDGDTTQSLRPVGRTAFKTREAPLTRELVAVDEAAWADLPFRHRAGQVHWVRNDARMEVSGFESDPFDPETPVTSFRFELPDGTIAIAHVTMQSFCDVADMLRKKYLK